MGPRILRGGGIAAVLVVGLAPLARAAAPDAGETEGPQFHLLYEASSGCPDRSAFLAAIHARTKRVHLAPMGDPAMELAVTIEASPESSIGQLEVREVDGTRQRRSVSNDRCSEVVEALALVVAVMLDPDAGLGDEPRPAPQASTQVRSPEPPAPTSARRAERPVRTERPDAPKPNSSNDHQLSLGAELGAMGAIAPVLAPAGGAFVDLDMAPGRSGLAPSFRLGIDVAGASSEAPAGRQSYWWAGGTVRGCPVRAALGPFVDAAPCAALAVGAHHAATTGVQSPTASTTPWLAALVGVSVNWAVTTAFTLELQGGAAIPLVRRRFFLAEPDTTIFEIPAISGLGTVAGRWRFW